MSWQLGAIVVLGLGLAGGFAWYERGRPDARIVALVATLAAFAALGRIAFAALPNVKPTTDIVLVSGYALGAAPGFVVGAAAGLVSNFFFGQGPWTPWQMAAWGVTGLLGAGLGRLTAHRIGRWPLAVVCMVAGFAFTAVQDVGDWFNFSDHSPAQLGVYVTKGLGFDAVHAGACLIFALAFGPALARSLARFATRLQVSWRVPTGAIVPAALIAIAALTAQADQGAGVARAAGNPASYLLSAQNRDGGFGPAPGQPSTQLFSGWAALGLAAEGYEPSRVVKDGHSLIGYLRSATETPSDPGSIERSILAARAAGTDPKSFGGHDLVSALRADIGRDGSVSDQTNLTTFGVLALRAAGETPANKTLAWLVAQQDPDGGFNYATAGGASDIDDTGAALEALTGDAGVAATRAIRRAVTFIIRHQDGDGGFPAAPGGLSNAQSTAWAVQGLIAAGITPTAVHRPGVSSPVAYLESLVAPDGHVRYSRSSDQTPVWVTAQAVMALAGRPLPVRAPAPAVRHPAVRSAGRRPASAGRRPASAAPQPASAHRKTGHRTGDRRRVSPSRQTRGSNAQLRLAADAGILEALVLAPIGVGG